MSAAGPLGGAGGGYHGFRPRPEWIPITAGVVDPAKSAERLRGLLGDAPQPSVLDAAAQPFVGITTDGVPRAGLFELADEGLDPAPLVAAANAFLNSLDGGARRAALEPVHSDAWRRWTNAFPAWEPHGVLLDRLDEHQRAAAEGLLGATLSPRGLRDVRRAMELNGALAELTGQYRDSLREWMYWLTIFGEPSLTEPWGWQLAGHHIDLNCLVLGRQLVLTPSFLGAEFDAETIFAEQRQAAFELVADLAGSLRDAAVLYPSMDAADLPKALAGRVDGRHLGGAGQDNRIVPPEGLVAARMSPGQRARLVEVCDRFLAPLPPSAARHRRAAIERHLDDTYFAWIGPVEPERACYFRVHSPVLLAEYDNHPGIFLDFDDPEPFHVHTVVRTPNGNDYGKDLLRAHYAAHHA